MKRFFLLAAALLTVCAAMTSCHKRNKENPDMPSIKWEENEGFATIEVVDGFKAPITVTAPLGLDVLTITCIVPAAFQSSANSLVGTAANKGEKPILDLIDDATLAEKIAALGYPTGASQRGKSAALKFDLAKLINAIIGDNAVLVKNNDTFEFEIRVRDIEAHELKKTARFHNTSAPELTADPAEVELNTSSAIASSVNIKAEGKLKGLILTFETESAGILSFLTKRCSSTGKPLVIDLVNDAKAVGSFADLGIATGSQVSGKELKLNLGKLMDQLKVEVETAANSSHKLTVQAIDENGKQGFASVTLRYSLPK